MSATAVSPMPNDDDDVPVQSDVARTAEAQGSNIPLGWRPTAREPVPVVRCITVKRDGTRCKAWSLRGTNVCVKHGGQLPVVQDHAAAVVEAGKLRLVGLTDLAIDQIEDLMVNASGEGIRLKAAQDVLDRANIKGVVEIDVTVKQEETAAERVQSRLKEIAARMEKGVPTPAPAPEPNLEEDIIDAEIEEGDDGGS